MSESQILILNNVSKVYEGLDGGTQIFSDLSWNLQTRQSYAVVGESGTGKSTLLHIIAALDKPSTGQVIVDGVDVVNLKEKELAHFRSTKIGIIFQFHFLLKEFTNFENVWIPAWMSGGSKKEAKKKAEELLVAVGLQDRMEHYPSQLSGGERQRAAVARALINDPSLILADEPTGNLDEGNSEIVQTLLLDLVKSYKKTLLLVTHDNKFAQRTDELWSLKQGKLVQMEKNN